MREMRILLSLLTLTAILTACGAKTPESFVDDCIAMAQNPEDRNGMRAWARSAFAWERVADKFERMMEAL